MGFQYPIRQQENLFLLLTSGLPFLLLMLFLLLLTSQTASAEVLPGSVQPFVFSKDQQPAPDTPFYDAEGKPRQLSAFRGQVVLVNFWASWCPACMAEMAALDNLQRQMADAGLKVLTLNQDLADASTIAAVFADYGVQSLPHHRDPDSQLGSAFGQTLLPTTLLIDARGVVVGSLVGPAEWDSPQALALIRQQLP